ncbi:unnamed product [Ostreococcus tauri]|uniref:Unnamed product n=2 Tax=Ostreococcus tauri TaxID=70448 RepID=A0A090M089_OSTTA|nr:unnamed product [Ostreococcus tauri]CEF97675.1 unnamed product [Ostreococcus tauri]|eukprot:XP_003078924.2 unnamed product [Ostreococcus tauri]
MRLELLTGAADPSSTAPDGVSQALDDARDAIATRDVRRALVAYVFIAERRFSGIVFESRRALELALDALALASAVVSNVHASLVERVAAAELGGCAARVVGACARSRRFARDVVGVAHAIAVTSAFASTATTHEELRTRAPRAVTSSALALMSIGSKAATRAVAAQSGDLGFYAFETPSAAMDLAHAIAYGVLANDVDAVIAMLVAWERPLDAGDEYARERVTALGGGSMRRVLENVIASGELSKDAVQELLIKSASDGKTGGVYVLAAIYRASVVLKDAETTRMCANELLELARAMEAWIGMRERDVALEARALACVTAISACVDVDATSGPLQPVCTLILRASCKAFALAHDCLLQSFARGRTPQEASRILQDLVTSPVYLNADFIAQAVSREGRLDAHQAISALIDFSAYWYATARDLASPERAAWFGDLDATAILPARAVVHEFVIIALKNILSVGSLEAHFTQTMTVLSYIEFSRAASVEYAQVLGAIANALGGLIPGGDGALALAFVDALPVLEGDAWHEDEMLASRIHLALRLLPFTISKLSVGTLLERVLPYVRACCDHAISHVVKAAHVAYVSIFHAHPELNDRLFPEYLNMALERYPTSTPLEPLIAAVGLATRFGEPGSRIALHIANELSGKVKSMDAMPTPVGSTDPPVEPLRRLLFQLVTLVDFPLIPAIQDILQDTVLDGADAQTRSRRHQTLAYTVMRCPDYARKPLMVDWVLRMSSKL